MRGRTLPEIFLSITISTKSSSTPLSTMAAAKLDEDVRQKPVSESVVTPSDNQMPMPRSKSRGAPDNVTVVLAQC